MEFNGKSPNGLNQNSVNSVSLFVSGSSILTATSESVSVVGKLSGSAVQTYQIGTIGGSPLQIIANTQITGSLNVSSSISASLFRGDGSGLTNINASSIGDIDRIKSGSATAIISPNLGLAVNTNTTISGSLTVGSTINGGFTLDVSGSTRLRNDVTVIKGISGEYIRGGNVYNTKLSLVRNPGDPAAYIRIHNSYTTYGNQTLSTYIESSWDNNGYGGEVIFIMGAYNQGTDIIVQPYSRLNSATINSFIVGDTATATAPEIWVYVQACTISAGTFDVYLTRGSSVTTLTAQSSQPTSLLNNTNLKKGLRIIGIVLFCRSIIPETMII